MAESDKLLSVIGQVSEASFQKVSSYTRVPEILPCAFDLTVEAWLERISFWGTLKMTRDNPETKRRETLTKRKLIDVLADSSLLSVTSKWAFKKLTFKSVEITRNYIDQVNKKMRDKIVVDIELDDDIKFIMNYWKNK